MKLKTLMVVAMTTLALAPPVALAAQKQPGPNDNARFHNPTSIGRIYQDYLYGVLKTAGKDELVLEKTKFGVDQTIRLEPKTKFIRDGKPSSLADIKTGEDVFVLTKKDKKTGELTAKKVVTGTITPEAP